MPRAFCRGSLPACALGVIWLWFAFLCRPSSTQRCVPPATVRILQKCPAREAVAVPTGRRVQYAKLPGSFGASVCSPAPYAPRNQFPSSLSAQSYPTHSETAAGVISSAGIYAILLSLCMCSLKCKVALMVVAPHCTACDIY